MTKSQFQTCIQAFYAEIRNARKTNLGNPNVVLYRNSGSSVKFNPRLDMRVGKTSVVTSGQEIPFSDIRGVNFFFDNEESNRPEVEQNINNLSWNLK